jgi:hypothetical protein
MLAVTSFQYKDELPKYDTLVVLGVISPIPVIFCPAVLEAYTAVVPIYPPLGVVGRVM